MRALVTGAAGAIGAAIVDRLLAEGGSVVAQDLHALPERFSSDNRVVPVVGDLREPVCRDAVFAAANDGGLNTVIAAHGAEGSGALTELTPERIRHIMTINYHSVVDLLIQYRPILRANDGTFVAIASQAALMGEAANSAYCASKFALLGFVRASGRGPAAETLRTRVLCPGATESSLFRDASKGFANAVGVDVDRAVSNRVGEMAIGRLGHPDEVAHAAVHLAVSPAPGGLVVAVNGGDVLW